jgi:hypothetical protein
MFYVYAMVHITISTQDALLSVGIMCWAKAHIVFVNLIAHSTHMISKLIEVITLKI